MSRLKEIYLAKSRTHCAQGFIEDQYRQWNVWGSKETCSSWIQSSLVKYYMYPQSLLMLKTCAIYRYLRVITLKIKRATYILKWNIVEMQVKNCVQHQCHFKTVLTRAEKKKKKKRILAKRKVFFWFFFFLNWSLCISKRN